MIYAVFLVGAVPMLSQVAAAGAPVWPWVLAFALIGGGLLVSIVFFGDEGAGCLATLVSFVGLVLGGWVGVRFLGHGEPDPRARLVGGLALPILVLAVAWAVVAFRRRRPGTEG